MNSSPTEGAQGSANCGTPRTDKEHADYPQWSNDHFGYRMVRIDFARRLEVEAAKYRKALELIARSQSFAGGTWAGELQGIASKAISNED